MGYYTDFELSVHEGDPDREKVAERLSELSTYEWDTDFFLNAKWYEFNLDMTKLSEEFPDVIFCLDGNGEENGDIWRAYYKNGKAQMCKAEITFEQFDESKLK
jgi:hypothetical protein